MSLRLTSNLYQAARKLRDVEVALSMDPKKLIKHFLINKIIMKKLVGNKMIRH